jgi:hypothetical protein
LLSFLLWVVEAAAVVKSLVVKAVEEAMEEMALVVMAAKEVVAEMAPVVMAAKEAVAMVGVVVLDLLVPDLQLYAVEVTKTNEFSINVVYFYFYC